MPKTGHFYHEVQSTTDVSVTDAFNAANKTDLNLNNFSLTTGVQKVGGVFVGRLEGLIIRVKSIVNAPTKLIIKVTHANNGTQVVIPDTEATIALEVGSTTAGGVAYKLISLTYTLTTKYTFSIRRMLLHQLVRLML